MRRRFLVPALVAGLVACAWWLLQRHTLQYASVPEFIRPVAHALGLPLDLQVQPRRQSPPVRAPAHAKYVAGELLVQLRAGVSEKTVERVLRHLGATVKSRFSGSEGLILVSLARGARVEDAAAFARSLPDIAMAGPNHIYHVDAIPNDPQYSSQWGLHTRDSLDPADPDIDAEPIWDEFTGGDEAVVGIIDSGVDIYHEDLRANIWENQDDIWGNGIDDDGNGYVDDTYGYNALEPGRIPFDSSGHGTHVAGTIGAVGNNGVGVSGVAWQTKLAACKFIGDDGTGTDAGAIACLDYFSALKGRGVNVVVTNNSWGGTTVSPLLYAAVQRHRDIGIVFVAAAGNDSGDNDKTPHYPSSFDLTNVISVGAIDSIGQRAWFSNGGRLSVDLFAPGYDILSTWPNNSLAYASGTSMAAPHVSGMIALYAALNPDLTASELIRNILDNVTPNGNIRGLCATGGVAHMVLPVTDRDQDGMDDRWERSHGLNSGNAADARQDPDGDGVDNLAEFKAGTDPFNADTDADGLGDGEELNRRQTNPLTADSDNDGLPDGDEVNRGTDPLVMDSDGDGVNDGREVLESGTDPLNADTDSDGMPDGFELLHGLDPRDASDADIDPDGDGLDNRAEAANGTDPFSTDTDFDNLPDDEELGRYGTSPILADSDGDGMFDGWEIEYGFDPGLAADGDRDADGDGALNRDEFRAGTNPRDATSVPPHLPWSGYRGGADRTGHVPFSIDTATLVQRWQESEGSYWWRDPPALGSGMAFQARMASDQPAVVAINLLDGSIVWQYSLPESTRVNEPVFGGGAVYALFRSYIQGFVLVCLNVDGTARFTKVIGALDAAETNARLTLLGDDLFLSAGNLLIALAANSGAERWRAPIPGDDASVYPDWLPAANQQHVAVFAGETLSVFNRATGQRRFSLTHSLCGFAYDALPMFDAAGGLYVNFDGCLAKFDVSSRRLVWLATDLSPYVRPTVAGTTVVVARNVGTLVALSAANGSELWSRQSSTFFSGDLVSTRTHVFVPQWGGLEAVSLANGQSTWESPATGRLAISDDGVLLVDTDFNGFVAFGVQTDLDSDAIPDWWERAYQLSPADPSDAGLDVDSDGLTNLEEFRRGSNPRRRDTDGDGLLDGAEAVAGSNPTVEDTDGDGLSDGREVNELHSSPLLRDSDRDQVDDIDEVNRYGTDPADASSRPALLFNQQVSFETGIPADWGSLEEINQTWIRSGQKASDGRYAIGATLEPSRPETGIEWRAKFATGEVAFDYLLPDENSFFTVLFTGATYGGREFQGGYANWQTARIAVPEGTTSIRFIVRDYRQREAAQTVGYLDNVRFGRSAPFGARSDNVLVVESNHLHEFSLDGKPTRAPVDLPVWPSSFVATRRHELAIKDGNLWTFYDLLNGDWRQVVDFQGTGAPQAATPDSILTTASGDRMARYGLDGSFREYVGELGTVFLITYGRDGFVYTIDRQANVRKYDAVTFDLQGIVSLGPYTAGAIAVDEKGRIHLLSGADRVLFDSSGNMLRSVRGSVDSSPINLLLTMDGRLVNRGLGAQLEVVDAGYQSVDTVRLGNGLMQYVFVEVALPELKGPDTDRDGCPDWWELANGTLPGVVDSAIDPDGDGLSNGQECLLGTDPAIPDTDRDGLTDGEERDFGSDPLVADTDGDGLKDVEERSAGTSPVLVDTDEDGLADKDEIVRTRTRPNDADSDDDGMPDGWEVTAGLNPLDEFDARLDPDADGLTNRQEFAIGTNVKIADTDGDTLNDGREVQLGTKPLIRDSDGDLLDDGFEVVNGFNALAVGETDQDNDGDGYSNLIEFRYQSNPRVNGSRPVPPAWSGHQGGAEHRGFVPVRVDAPKLSQRWRARFSVEYSRPVSALSISGRRLYGVIDNFGSTPYVFGAEAIVGDELWRRLFERYSLVTPPSVDRNAVIVQQRYEGNGYTIRMDGGSGNSVFKKPFLSQGFNLPAPVIKDQYIVGPTGYYGGIAAWNLDTGVQLWSIEPGVGVDVVPAVTERYVLMYGSPNRDLVTGLIAFDLKTGVQRNFILDSTRITDYGSSTPVAGFHDDVYLVHGGRLLCFDLAAGKIRWVVDGPFAPLPPALGMGEVYIVQGNVLIAFDEKDGRERWRWSAPQPLIWSPVATVDHVFVSTGARLYAVSVPGHASVWSVATSGQVAVGDNRLVYVSEDSGHITAYASFADVDRDGTADTEDVDRDGDGMLNDWEAQHGFDPDNPADGLSDADGDGLINVREHGLMTDPRVADTDGDGVGDLQEVEQNLDPLDATCAAVECTLLRKGVNIILLNQGVQR